MPLHKTFGVDLGTSTVKSIHRTRILFNGEKHDSHSQPEADSGSRK